MDKEKTGRLIAQARKERGLTQRQLAERLHITAKAVSKWETGVSAPDVGLLIPLAEELGLSATELLEGRRMAVPEDRSPEQVEDIVKSALTYSEQSPAEKAGPGLRRLRSRRRPGDRGPLAAGGPDRPGPFGTAAEFLWGHGAAEPGLWGLSDAADPGAPARVL